MARLSDEIKQKGTQVRVVEVGPRDGLQNSSITLSVDERVAMIEGLAAAGHTDVEVGSFVHPRWIPPMANTGEVVRKLTMKEGVRYWALIPNMRGLEDALDAGIRHVAVFLSSSETHNQRNLNRSIDQSLQNVAEVAAVCRAEEIPVRGYISTVFGCPYEGDVDFSRVIDLSDAMFEMGAEQVSLGDTTGMGEPIDVEPKLERVMERFSPDTVALHVHDTRGVAQVIVTIALRIGLRIFDASVGGMGGCPYAPGAAGNLATEDLLHLLDGFELVHGVDMRQIVAISTMLKEKGVRISSRYYPYFKGQLDAEEEAAATG